MAMLCLDEIGPGLACHLDPDILREFGADDCKVKGRHDFVVLRTHDGYVLLLPTSSKRGRGRIQIPQEAKSGHERWTGRETYVPAFPFGAREYAVQEASRYELSDRGKRNRVSLECVAWLLGQFAPSLVS